MSKSKVVNAESVDYVVDQLPAFPILDAEHDNHYDKHIHLTVDTKLSDVMIFSSLLCGSIGIGLLIYGFTTTRITVLDDNCQNPLPYKYSHVISSDEFSYYSNYSTLEINGDFSQIPVELSENLSLNSIVHECVQRGSDVVDVLVACFNNNVIKFCLMYRWKSCSITTINTAFYDDAAGAVFIGSTLNDSKVVTSSTVCISSRDFCIDYLTHESSYIELRSNIKSGLICKKQVDVSKWTTDPKTFLSGSITGLVLTALLSLPKIIGSLNKTINNDNCSKLFFRKDIILERCDIIDCKRQKIDRNTFADGLDSLLSNINHL